VICCARVIKIPFLILLSSLYANKVQKRSRSLQKTAERERGGEQQLLRIKTSVITHVLLVHNDAGDDDDEKKYRR
jgi:ABC-type multidrug transport system fused ATPase/permease subunit